MIDQQTSSAEVSKPLPLSKFKVRMWSDCGTEEYVIIESYSIYEAALDARYEHPEFENYDAVRCEQ
jgi:hypothetical protein